MNFFTDHLGGLQCRLYKLLLALPFFFLLSGLLPASALGYGQQLTLNAEKITIKQVFRAVKMQTGYDVLFDPGQLDAGRVIAVHFSAAPLSEVMTACLQGSGLSYVLTQKSIVLQPSAVRRPSAAIMLPQDSVIYRGVVSDEKGQPLAGATVRLRDSKKSTFTSASGEFSIYAPRKGTLVVSYIGYLNREITLLGASAGAVLKVPMIAGVNNLGEVSVLSTGYQEIAKERATGSFEVISKEQLQHSTDPNLLRRLEGLTTSMDFNNQLVSSNSGNDMSRQSPLLNLTIRGKNTLNPNNVTNSSGQVLVVIDGIASPYPIDNVNPNDVESVTVLKDAAAASIWGSRASNGVIVVKTKRGGYNRPLSISFNSNFNITGKLDLFYKRTMSVPDFIDAQVLSFNTRYDPADPSRFIPDPSLSDYPQSRVSPVFELLNAHKLGRLSDAELEAQLNGLRGNDIRRDFTDYFLRSAVRQSYSLGVDGGSGKMTYRVSGGYDRSLNNTHGSDADRATLNYSASFRLLKNLELSANLGYSLSRTSDILQHTLFSPENSALFVPYGRLADGQGNFLPLINTYRPGYLDLLESAYGDRLLSMRYVPLQDIKEGYRKSRAEFFNIGLNLGYQLGGGLSASLSYNYNRSENLESALDRGNSFYMRNLVNTFTDPATFNRSLPAGGLYAPQLGKGENQTLRGQLNYTREWGQQHALSAIIGVDISQTFNLLKRDEYYGYDEQTLSSQQSLAYGVAVPTLFNYSTTLPYLSSGFSNARVRTFSSYANAAYTFKQRYTLSASIRRDGSSEFGEGVNKSGTPFYSAGLSWNISKEPFYELEALPRLQLRATFGYNGNTNPLVVAIPNIGYSQSPHQSTGLLYGSAGNASNRLLRPEKTGMLNLGLDFGLRNSRISGSIEYYNKLTEDLLSGAPVDPSTGFNNVVYNTARLRGWGWDFTLNTVNLRSGSFSWNSSLLFGLNRVKVKEVYSSSPDNAGNYVLSGLSLDEGYDLSRLFAFTWGGLDPATGDPRGILDGQPLTISNTNEGTNNFVAIQNAPGGGSSSLRYMGSTVPVYFGSMRHTFSYRGFSLSASLLYKLGYYFRRQNIVRYGSLFSGTLQPEEYGQRWQKPGDEALTSVPSFTLPVNGYKDIFYQFSEINVLRADHVRLQEINLSYGFNQKAWRLKNVRVYGNVSNLGILWRANKQGLDPEAYDYPLARAYSLGLSANF